MVVTEEVIDPKTSLERVSEKLHFKVKNFKETLLFQPAQAGTEYAFK